jgi:putative RecB family exonuclease
MEAARHFSVSQIQTYLGCPLQYRFRYIDQLPRPWRPAALAFGTSVHAAIEWWQKERLAGRDPRVDEALEQFDADWYAQTIEPLVFSERESKDSLLEQGRALVRLYLERSNTVRPVAVEERFELDLADPETGELLEVRLRGYIDCVEEGGTLVEVKTANRMLPSGDLARHLQLSTYALVFFLHHQFIPKHRLHKLLKTKTPRLERLPTTRSIEDLSWTARLIERAAQAIESGHFYPNPSWRCTECEYFAHCQKWRGEEAQVHTVSLTARS